MCGEIDISKYTQTIW